MTMSDARPAPMEKPALFWDFHGTLTLPDITWFDAAREAALEMTPHRPLQEALLQKHLQAQCLPWFTVPDRDTRHLAGSERWWAHTRREFEAMLGRCGFTHEEAQKIAPVIQEKVLEPERYQLYPDAVPTLRELQRRGYKSYILSNNFPELEDIVRALGIRDCFEAVLVSGLIGYDKPRREIFDHARRAAGIDAPGAPTPWMIGDNPADDVEGGKAAGWRTVAVHGRPAPGADHQADEIADLLEIFP